MSSYEGYNGKQIERKRWGMHAPKIPGPRDVTVRGLCLKPLGHQGPAEEIEVSDKMSTDNILYMFTL